MKKKSHGDYRGRLLKLLRRRMSPQTAKKETLEEWKPITKPAGYEQLYEISNHGRVQKRKEKTLVPRHSPTSRPTLPVVTLRKDGVSTGYSLARLVAFNFLPPGKGYLRHRDGRNDNCRADNLFYSHAKKEPEKKPYRPLSVWEMACPQIENLLKRRKRKPYA